MITSCTGVNVDQNQTKGRVPKKCKCVVFVEVERDRNFTMVNMFRILDHDPCCLY